MAIRVKRPWFRGTASPGPDGVLRRTEVETFRCALEKANPCKDLGQLKVLAEKLDLRHTAELATALAPLTASAYVDTWAVTRRALETAFASEREWPPRLDDIRTVLEPLWQGAERWHLAENKAHAAERKAKLELIATLCKVFGKEALQQVGAVIPKLRAETNVGTVLAALPIAFAAERRGGLTSLDAGELVALVGANTPEGTPNRWSTRCLDQRFLQNVILAFTPLENSTAADEFLRYSLGMDALELERI